MTLPLPALDPMPLPAPAWLFHLLLVVTFLIHILFLSVTLGGSIIAAAHRLLAGWPDGPGRRLGRLVAGFLPTTIAFTITTGVAPLLFVQVLYGQVFYPATILVGWVWLSLLVLLGAGYYATYLFKYKAGGKDGLAAWLLVAALAFLGAAAIQVLVNVLELTPSRWVAVGMGAADALRDPTLLPRYLHFVLGSLAVGGVFLGLLATERARRDPDPFYPWLAQRGLRWALVATGLQVADGFWFLFALPLGVLQGIMQGRFPETPTFALAVGLGVLLLILLSRTMDPIGQPALIRLAAGVLLLTLAGMIVLRDMVRGLYLAPFVRLREVPSATQGDLLAVFSAVFLLGLLTVAWMLWKMGREQRAA